VLGWVRECLVAVGVALTGQGLRRSFIFERAREQLRISCVPQVGGETRSSTADLPALLNTFPLNSCFIPRISRVKAVSGGMRYTPNGQNSDSHGGFVEPVSPNFQSYMPFRGKDSKRSGHN
jgi:hypothetical protein